MYFWLVFMGVIEGKYHIGMVNLTVDMNVCYRGISGLIRGKCKDLGNRFRGA